jgi:hypothetical protein
VLLNEQDGSVRALNTILIAGAVAGALDLTDACVYAYMKAQMLPQDVFRVVASGLLGKASFTAGALSASLGVVLHFIMATMAAAFFYFAARAVPLLTKYPIPLGLLYGFAFYGLMTFVVVPLSAVPMRRPPHMEWNGLFTHTVLFGLPIALIVRQGLRQSLTTLSSSTLQAHPNRR